MGFEIGNTIVQPVTTLSVIAARINTKHTTQKPSKQADRRDRGTIYNRTRGARDEKKIDSFRLIFSREPAARALLYRYTLLSL